VHKNNHALSASRKKTMEEKKTSIYFSEKKIQVIFTPIFQLLRGRSMPFPAPSIFKLTIKFILKVLHLCMNSLAFFKTSK